MGRLITLNYALYLIGTALQKIQNKSLRVQIHTQHMEDNIAQFFPLQPYKIQEAFASQLYQAIGTKKIGFFESPTGTVYNP